MIDQIIDALLRVLNCKGLANTEGRRDHVITFVVASNQSVMELEKGLFRKLKRGHSVPLYIFFPRLDPPNGVMLLFLQLLLINGSSNDI